MSKTPLTDAEVIRFARIMIEWHKPTEKQITELVPADFARQFEQDAARYRHWRQSQTKGFDTPALEAARIDAAIDIAIAAAKRMTKGR